MTKQLKTILRTALAVGAIALLSAAPVRADESGFYFGGSGARVSSDCCAEDSALAFRGFAGYRFNQNIGAEVGYASVGDFNARTVSFTGIARAPTGTAFGDIFARGGLHSWTQGSRSGTNAVFGGGTEIFVGDGPLGFRSELLYYTGEAADFVGAGLGIVIRPRQ